MNAPLTHAAASPRQPQPTSPDPPRLSRLLVALFIIAAMLLVLRNLAFDSPLMAGDEYAYAAAAQTFPDPSARFAGDSYLPRIYSPVFSGYGRLLFGLSPRPEYLIKVLNVLAFVGATALFLPLAPAIGGRAGSRLLAAWLLITPISAYTAYFMPESTYVLFFAVLAWLVVKRLPERPLTGGTLCGVVVGVMLLIKPHAFALAVALGLTFAVVAVAPRRLRPPRRVILISGALCAAGAYLTLIVLNLALSGRLALHPFTFVGGVYRPVLTTGGSPMTWIQYPRELVTIFAGHAIVLGALLAPAIGAALDWMRRLYADGSASPRTVPDARVFSLIAFTCAVAVATVGMTTVFTAFVAQLSAIEHLRLHGRYYSFFLALFFVIYFARYSGQAAGDDVWLRRAAGAGAMLAALILYLHGKRLIFPFDFPEAFVFSSWAGQARTGVVNALVLTVRYGAVFATVAVYALIAFRGRRAWLAYPALLIPLFAASHAGVSGWQRAVSREQAPIRADARAARQLIAAEALDRGVVVGPEWNGALAYFLFNFQASPRVLVHDPAVPLTRADLPPDAEWAVLIGPYRADLGAPGWRTSAITFVALK
jgi:phosphoglycerol transferase